MILWYVWCIFTYDPFYNTCNNNRYYTNPWIAMYEISTSHGYCINIWAWNEFWTKQPHSVMLAILFTAYSTSKNILNLDFQKLHWTYENIWILFLFGPTKYFIAAKVAVMIISYGQEKANFVPYNILPCGHKSLLVSIIYFSIFVPMKW